MFKKNLHILLYTSICSNKYEDIINPILQYNSNISLLNKIKNCIPNSELLSNILNAESYRWMLNSGMNEHDRYSTMLERIKEEVAIEVFQEMIVYPFMNYIMESLGIGVDYNSIYSILSLQNYKVKNILIEEEYVEHFKNIITLLNMSNNNNSHNSVIYIIGPPGTGKTITTINELIKNNFTVIYINTSNILYGPYKENNIYYILSKIWDMARDLKNNNKKVVFVFDDAHELIKKRHKDTLDDNTINNIIVNEHKSIENILTIFFLNALSQKSIDVVLISNPSYDKDGNLDIDDAINRRIHYMFELKLPSLKNLVNLWRFYLKLYNINIIDGNMENIIYYLAEISYKNKISIRNIGNLTLSMRNKNIFLKDLLQFLQKI